MSFLSPLFLIGVLAAALPVILHFTLRGRAPRLPFSHVRFLERAFVHRDLRRRLRELILLALRVAAIVLLALAFARPFLDATDSATEDDDRAARAADSVAGGGAPAVTGPAGTVDPTGVLVVVNAGTLEPDALYLTRAMDAAPPERPFAVRAVAPEAVASAEPPVWDATDVVVVVGTTGLSRPGRARIAQFVGDGGGLLLVAGPGVDPSLVGDLLGPPVELAMSPPEEDGARRLAVADPRHRVFRPFGDRAAALGQAQFSTTVRTTLPAAEVLARFDDGAPALLEYPDAPGRVLIFGSDLNDDWNDFPRRPGYVPFVHEALRYLAPRTPDGPPPGDAEAASRPPPADVEPDAEPALWWYVVVALGLVLVGELFVGRNMV
ncbi:MAG: hypothetical protein F4Y45_15685 [Acidobacteria bacterium]|nr:hypothetical protein [Acidobacteriota bacterium]MYJ03285.1 hypothetical protein [Acidobacteriota bacterium]